MKGPLEQFLLSSQTVNANQSFRKPLKESMIGSPIAEPNILVLSLFRNEDIDHLTPTLLLFCFGMVGTPFLKASRDG